jgi:hypothetical protein
MLRFTRLPLFLVLALPVGCDKGEPDNKEGAAEAEGSQEPPFEVKVAKVEVLDEVAPNQTYLDNGLGKKAGEGKTFVCVQYEVTNKGGAEAREAGAEGRMKVKVSALPPAKVVDPDGTETQVSVAAAGSYQPADWKTDRGDVEPGKTAKKADCFEVAKGKTNALELVFDGRSWSTKTALPAAG